MGVMAGKAKWESRCEEEEENVNKEKQVRGLKGR